MPIPILSGTFAKRLLNTNVCFDTDWQQSAVYIYMYFYFFSNVDARTNFPCMFFRFTSGLFQNKVIDLMMTAERDDPS